MKGVWSIKPAALVCKGSLLELVDENKQWELANGLLMTPQQRGKSNPDCWIVGVIQ